MEGNLEFLEFPLQLIPGSLSIKKMYNARFSLVVWSTRTAGGSSQPLSHVLDQDVSLNCNRFMTGAKSRRQSLEISPVKCPPCTSFWKPLKKLGVRTTSPPTKDMSSPTLLRDVGRFWGTSSINSISTKVSARIGKALWIDFDGLLRT